MAVFEGTSWSDVLTGTSGDDIFDSKGGNDTIDGLSGNDQLLIFEDSSKFKISTLAGVTKIDGNYNAGDYAYDLITLTNVETVQFNDTLLSLDTSSQSIIEGTSWMLRCSYGDTSDAMIFLIVRAVTIPLTVLAVMTSC